MKDPAKNVQIRVREFKSVDAKTYHLKLAAWGPMSEGGDVSVSQAVYDRLEPGSTACIVMRSGALGMPWFIVLACR